MVTLTSSRSGEKRRKTADALDNVLKTGPKVPLFETVVDTNSTTGTKFAR